jgi:hypothetical protein
MVVVGRWRSPDFELVPDDVQEIVREAKTSRRDSRQTLATAAPEAPRTLRKSSRRWHQTNESGAPTTDLGSTAPGAASIAEIALHRALQGDLFRQAGMSGGEPRVSRAAWLVPDLFRARPLGSRLPVLVRDRV